MKILLTTLAAGALWLILTSLWGFYTSIRPSKIISNITPKNLGLDYEEVSFPTPDGLTLRGWFIPQQGAPQEASPKTIILLHGYPADKGDILPALAFLNKKYNLFLFDFRYLGRSEGQYSTVGAKEVADLKAALGWLKERGIGEVGVWGLSMGGAVAIMTAPQAPEIKAVVAEASYAELNLLAPALYPIPLLKKPLAALTGFWTKVFLGIDLASVSPAASAKLLTKPILVIHSQTDQVIPFQHALLLQEALKENPKAEFWFPEGLAHGELILRPKGFNDKADNAYQKRLEDFFQKNLLSYF